MLELLGYGFFFLVLTVYNMSDLDITVKNLFKSALAASRSTLVVAGIEHLVTCIGGI